MNLRQKCFMIALIFYSLAPTGLLAKTQIDQNNSQYQIKSGDTLADIALKRYGNRRYMGLIAMHNGIEDYRHIVAGGTLSLPGLMPILEQEGLNSCVSDEMKSILSARKEFMNVETELWEIRKEAPRIIGDPGTPRPNLDLPGHIVESLLAASGLLQSAAQELGQPRGRFTYPPLHLIGQLQKAAENLERQAQGIQDGYGYDMDMVHQRIALALVNAIIWAREGF